MSVVSRTLNGLLQVALALLVFAGFAGALFLIAGVPAILIGNHHFAYLALYLVPLLGVFGYVIGGM